VSSLAVTPFPDANMPDEPNAFAHWVFDAIWVHRRFGGVRDAYAPHAHWTGPSERRLFGHGEIAGWLVALFACSSDARVSVDHVASVTEGPFIEIAVRWTLVGTHDGVGLYGAPSGKTLSILGVTHWRTLGMQIVDDVTIYDEIALFRQMAGGL
jgi:hypothetical protein